MPPVLSLLTLPLLLLVSLPLLLFAILTTILAISTLLLRVLLIYAELFIVLLTPVSIATTATIRGRSASTQKPFSSSSQAPNAKPVLQRNRSNPIIRSNSGLGLGIYTSSSSTAVGRDFEGLGGWRHAEDEDPASDERWTRMNSRLELPSPAPPLPPAAGPGIGERDNGKRRHHGRSLTGGSLGLGVAMPVRSPARSRTRARTSRNGVVGDGDEGYEGREEGPQQVVVVARPMGWSKSTTDLGTGFGMR